MSITQHRFDEHLACLRRYAAQNGHTNPPIVYVDESTGLPLGRWVATARYAYRSKGLRTGYIQDLETVPGWHWERRLRGRPQLTERNQQIRSLHDQGASITVLAEKYGVTTQRIHQVIKKGR